MAAQVDYSLYVVLDSRYLRGTDPGMLVGELCEGGATVIQYRAKGEGSPFHREMIPPILEASRPHGVPLIINDELELALRFDADGVHLGQADLSIAEARKRTGSRFIVGATVHDVTETARAIEQGADYISVGSMYPTDTKSNIRIVGPDMLEEICRISTIPTIAIGGITEERLPDIFSRGARGVAIVSAILDSPAPGKAAHRLKETIERLIRSD